MKAVEENPERVTHADVVVGIPSYNEGDRIAFPTEQADRGLTQYFGDLCSVIINCDNNSPDRTRDVFMGTSTANPKIYLSTPEGTKGKGNNIANLCAKCIELAARAIIVVDADLTSITPRWIRNLGQPLFEDFDYVSPLYTRHKYDGTITNTIAYPLTRTLYGRRIRQPIGGDFGFSGRLAKRYVELAGWSNEVANFGIDIWMTTIAMTSGLAVAQSFLGRPKIHRPKDPGADLGPMFAEVVRTIFDLMCHFEDFWAGVKWSRPTAIHGFGLGEVELPPPVEVDLKVLRRKFSAGIESFRGFYREFLPQEICSKLIEISELPPENFEFPTMLWAKTLYDFATAYKKRTVAPNELTSALVPLYYGRVLSFVRQTEAMDTQQVEEIIDEQCLQFEKTKRYLLERWFS